MVEAADRIQIDKSQVEELGKTIWDWLVVNPTGIVGRADTAIAFGGRKLAVAYQTAEIGNQGFVNTIVVSGGRTRLTAHWPRPEAGVFAAIIKDLGFKGRVIEEDMSENSGDNLQFSYLKLLQEGVDVSNLICVLRAPVQRRVQAVALKKLPQDINVTITSPDLDYQKYVEGTIGDETLEELIMVMTGEVDRMQRYHLSGFQIKDTPPKHVLEARERLRQMDFVSR